MNALIDFVLSSFEDYLRSNPRRFVPVIKRISPLQVQGNSYMHPTIVENISQSMTFHCHEDIVLKDGFHVRIDYYDDIEPDTRDVKFILNYTIFLIHLFRKITHHKTHLDIQLYAYKGQKRNPPKHQPFTNLEVNSGVTMTNGLESEGGQVIVYRKEEMIKVLTHELVHFFDIDAKYISPDEEKEFTEFFCLEKTIKLNEAFTDTVTCLINTIMYTILECHFYHKLHDFQTTFKNNLKAELAFIDCQAQKVLAHAKYDKSCIHVNKEKTHAISYYVIKSILLRKPDSFVKFFVDQGMRLKDLTGFKNLIKKNLSLSSPKDCRNYQKHINTMRMTSLDIFELRGQMKTI